MSPVSNLPALHRRATLRQCAILVGGLGTRLGALTATTPKPILPVGGHPFLYWLMREVSRFGVEEILLLTGHLSERVQESVREIAASLPRPVSIVFSEEPVRAGTGGALFHARHLLDDRFLLCNGDSLFDCNLALLLAASARDPEEVIGRMVLRPLADTSRYGVVELDGDRVTAFHERPASGNPELGKAEIGKAGLINAGIYVFDRRVLNLATEICSLERDIMPRLAAEGALRGTVPAQTGRGYFIDIGIPEDFARAQTELPATLRRPALFLDRDGVINIDHGHVGSIERFEWVPGAPEAIALATSLGWHVFVVTNQSGVARGFYDEAAVHTLMDWIGNAARAAGGTIDDYRYCPFHPEGAVPEYARVSDWRKPEPGMIIDLLKQWGLDPARCLLVGDQPTDVAAAQSAGMPGHLFKAGNLAAFLRPLLAYNQ